MTITDVQWSDEGRHEIMATVDGQKWQIPADPKNRLYAEILREGIEIAPPPAPAD